MSEAVPGSSIPSAAATTTEASPTTSTTGPSSSNTRKNGSASRPTAPKRGLPTIRRCFHSSCARPCDQRCRCRPSTDHVSGTSVQHTVSGTNTIRQGRPARRRCSCRVTTSSASSASDRGSSPRSEEHTSELQSRQYLVCRLLLEKKKNTEK